MVKSMFGLVAGALLGAASLVHSPGHAAETPKAAEESDWPQYCGPNRDSNVLSSPKLLDAWPKEGPPLLWKSDLIPGWLQGGCGGPSVSDGKVFVYATAKNPVGGGNLYKIVTSEVLAAAGWMEGVPADLAKKIEDARVLKGRPSCDGWIWVEVRDPKEKEKDLDAFLAKKPELDKYIKDFISKLSSEEATKYGSFIKYRLCISPASSRGKGPSGMTWDQGDIPWDALANLSKLQGVGYPTLREWSTAWTKTTKMRGLGDHLGIGGYFPGFLYSAWMHSFTRIDTLVCLDAATGKTLWKKEFPVDADIHTKLNLNGGTHNPAAYLGACGTPTIADGKCYFGGLMGLYCLSAKDGALLWQVKRPSSNTPVLVANGMVYYCGCAYDAASGKVLWTSPLWKDSDISWANNTQPSFWKSGEKTYVISGNGGDSICCLDLETGKSGWTLKVRNYSGFGPCNYVLHNNGDILIADNKIYHITPTELQPLKTLEDTVLRSGFNPGVMSADYYYAETSGGEGGALKLEGLCCWDFKTGALKWSAPHIEMAFCAPPILVDGKMIVANGVGGQEGMLFNNWKVMMIKATPDKYEPLGTFAPNMIPWTPMAFVGGNLFVRTEVGISCYDLRAK